MVAGDCERTVAALQDLDEPSAREQIEALLLEAQVSQRPTAVVRVRAAAALAAHGGLLHTFLREGPDVIRLARRAHVDDPMPELAPDPRAARARTRPSERLRVRRAARRSRARAPAAAPDPPHLWRDRRTDVRVDQHRQDLPEGPVPEVERREAGRGRRHRPWAGLLEAPVSLVPWRDDAPDAGDVGRLQTVDTAAMVYDIAVRGHLSPSVAAAFDEFELTVDDDTTVLHGEIVDRAALAWGHQPDRAVRAGPPRPARRPMMASVHAPVSGEPRRRRTAHHHEAAPAGGPEPEDWP